MVSLRQELLKRGISYKSKLSNRALDIHFASVAELCEALGYISKCMYHLDGEYPEEMAGIDDWNMPITDGTTSGGHKMKWGREYRVYLKSVKNCPVKIREQLYNDSRMRFGCGKFVEALLCCGFMPGYSQDRAFIRKTIYSIFTDPKEQAAFVCGYNLNP